MDSELTRDKALHDLEWSRIETAVRERLACPDGGSERLSLASTREATARALTETGEAYALLQRADPLPLDGLRSLDATLARVARQGVLEAQAFNDLRSVLRAARVLRRFLAARRELVPALVAACPLDGTLDRLLEVIEGAFDPAGTLADHASPELRRLRSELHGLRGRLVGRLEELVHKNSELLSDRFYTLRDGRYVLPVRADAHERVHGIVHGASGSGSTIFVEPRALIELGNRLKLAEAEESREVQRILAALSEQVRDELPSLQAAYDALLHADVRAASARLAVDLKCTRPTLSPGARIVLKGARHALLALDGVAVVPNDVQLEAGHALVISGPNAGGKTVVLKLLGLSALMLRAGLFLLADEGSECGFFAEVLSDVGDEQSLSRNLSTFSAHVQNLVRILDAAGPESLVLLDELAGSTDPEEGGALACAIVESLCARGAAVAVTTHYEALKAAALTSERLRNASVSIEAQTMKPTFRLRLDAPGASSALLVAERFGMPSSVLERARAVLPERTHTFERLVAALHDKLGQADRDGLVAETARVAAERARMIAEEELSRVRAREKKKLGDEAEALHSALRSARQEVDDARKVLRRKVVDESEVKRIRERVTELARETNSGGSLAVEGSEETALDVNGEPAAFDEIVVGAKLFVPRLRTDVEVLEPPNKGKVRVAAGPLRMWIELADLRKRAPADAPAAVARPEVSRAVVNPSAAVASSDNTLDLRGMRVDDALAMLESFLDRLYGQSQNVAYIKHGVGSGALRDAVRSWLAQPSPYVASYGAGDDAAGGERITVIVLR